MSVAYRVQNTIAKQGLYWEPVFHGASATAAEAARAAHVPQDRVAKTVVLEDDLGYVAVVIGADCSLDIDALGAALGRDLELATEPELRSLFGDCATGAVPPLAAAYGIPTLWDDALARKPDVYFEGGDHHTLVHMTGADFAGLMQDAQPLRRYR